MTEEIIINGVNVSGCEFIAKEDEYSSYDRVYKGQCRCSNEEMCKNHPNCFYKKALKQLKRKEQECENLKKKLKPKLKNAHCVYFDGQTGWCKAKEFTRCNPIGCKLYTIDELSTIVDLQEQIKQKEQEYEELKKERDTLSVTRNKLLGDLWVAEENLKDYIEHFNKASDELDQLKAEKDELKKELQAQRDFTVHEQKLIYCVAYDETCKTGNDCKQEKCIFKDNIKLKQALAEIKETAKNMNNECFYSDFNCKDCDMKNGCTYFNKKQILQKISECEVKHG